MDAYEIIASAERLTLESPGNYIAEEIAIRPEYAGVKFYDAPIFAFGSADDDLFQKFLAPSVIGSHFITPLDWLPGAKTVISCFLPYTQHIKSSNSTDFSWPSGEMLHGRYEGHFFIMEMAAHIQSILRNAGYDSVAPMLDSRFKAGSEETSYTSNWSERHVAFACGLGTFGLSKGIITEKGMCGRLCSVVTEMDLPKTGRPYTGVYEYCIMCGACAEHCPVNAISLQEGKKHPPCDEFLGKVIEKEKPRYACSKCQVMAPCESGIPIKVNQSNTCST
jgi:epoxyqueuosine reductase QueG